MELVAMHLKLSGSYIVRQLSFYGVSFSIDEVKLDEEFSSMYNKSVRLVSFIILLSCLWKCNKIHWNYQQI